MRPSRIPGVSTRSKSATIVVSPYAARSPSPAQRRFVLRPEAVNSIPAVGATARDRASASASMLRPADWMRAFDLVVRAFGPRRSHSTSRRTRPARVSW
jgi:hypothetical protein